MRFVAVPLLLLTSCALHNKVAVEELPLAPRVRSVANPPRPKLVTIDRAKEVPGAIPFAVVTVHGINASVENAMRLAWQRSAKLNPDIALAEPLGQEAWDGMGLQPALFGITSVSSNYYTKVRVLCCKMPAVTLGCTTNELGMVTALATPCAAREAGIIEGDLLTAVGGLAVVNGADWYKSPHFAALLDAAPGQELEFGWIRPGKGLQTGRGRLTAATQTWTALVDPFPWDAPVTAVDNY